MLGMGFEFECTFTRNVERGNFMAQVGLRVCRQIWAGAWVRAVLIATSVCCVALPVVLHAVQAVIPSSRSLS